VEYLFAHRFLASLDPFGNKLWAHAQHLGKVLLPNPVVCAPGLYSFDDFFSSLAHTSNVSRYTHSVKYLLRSLHPQCSDSAMTREFYLGFLSGFVVGILVTELLQVIVTLIYTL
jgi:hypothetical protein